MFQSTHERFVDGYTSQTKAKRNEAIAAFIRGDFISTTLAMSDELQLYTNGPGENSKSCQSQANY